MNIDFVEKIVQAFVEGDRKGLISLLNILGDSESELNHRKNVVRIKNLIKKIPSKGFVTSSINLSNPSDLKKQSSLFEYINSDVLLEDTVLEHGTVGLISDFLNEWENYSKLKKFDVYPTNKLLFYGPPGTGKTNLAYGVANKLGFPLILVRLDEVISSYLGKTGKNIREIFDIAEKESVVLLLDEIDTLAKHRDDNTELGELKRVVTVLLQNIDRFPTKSILIGATNHEKLLDNAIWRRFQLKIDFKNPSKVSRKAMFKMYLNGFIDEKLLDLLVDISDSQTGSFIKDICQKVKKVAILDNRKKININDIAIVFNISSKKDGSKLSSSAKDHLYKICDMFIKNGLSIKAVSEITGIPYSTIRDNIKK
jgi:SpoVK/Ycf46/Vps4 family AAA+-type ATPase